MKTYHHEFVIRCELKKVWDFFMSSNHFEVISPEDLNEKLIKSSTNRLALGTELWISTDLFVRRTWHSRITKLEEFREFVDEVPQDRLFAKWIHSHKFSQIDTTHTLVADNINFQFRYWIFGQMMERIIYPKLERIFAYRENKTKEILE